MAVDVFISCSTRDKQEGSAICDALVANDVSFWSPLSLKPGDMSQAPSIGRVLVLVFTPHAAASSRIAQEVQFAITHQMPIISLAVGDAQPADPFSRLVGTQHWHQAPGKSIVDALDKLVYSVTMTLARLDQGTSVKTVLRDELAPSADERPKAKVVAPPSVKLPGPARPKVKVPVPPKTQSPLQRTLPVPPGAEEKPPRPESPMQTRTEPGNLSPGAVDLTKDADNEVIEVVLDTSADTSSDAPPIAEEVVEIDLADQTPSASLEVDFANEIAKEIVDEIDQSSDAIEAAPPSSEIEIVLDDDEPATSAAATPTEADTISQEIEATLAQPNGETAELSVQRAPKNIEPRPQTQQDDQLTPDPQQLFEQQEPAFEEPQQHEFETIAPAASTSKRASKRIILIASIFMAVLALGFAMTYFMGGGSKPLENQSITAAPKTTKPDDQLTEPDTTKLPPAQKVRAPQKPVVQSPRTPKPKPIPKSVVLSPAPSLPKPPVSPAPAEPSSPDMAKATNTLPPTITHGVSTPALPTKLTVVPDVSKPEKIKVTPPSDLAIVAVRLNAAGRKQYNTAMKAFRQQINQRAAEARKMVTKAELNAKQNQQDIAGQLQLGKALVNAHEYARAILILDRVISADPSSADAYLLRGEVHLKLGAHDAAINDFKRVQATKPREMLAYMGLGYAYRGQQDMQESANQFKTATRMRYTNPKPFTEYGLALIELRKFDQATKALDRAVYLNSKYAPAYDARGQMAIAQAERTVAIRIFTVSIKADNRYAPAYAHRGKAYLDSWSFARAAADLATATSLDPTDIQSHVLLAEALLELNDASQALNSADQALSLDPMSASAHSTRAIVLTSLGWYAYAIEHANWAIHLDDHLAKAFAVRGDILAKQGQWTKAMSDYSESIRLEPMLQRALLGRCELYRHTGQYDGAMADAAMAIKANPPSARAYAQRAMIYRDQGQFARGIDDCDRALHLQPGHAFTLRRRAIIAMGEKQFEDANDDISRAFDYDLLSAEAFALRGAALLGRDDPARSLAYANEAVSFDPNNSSCYRIRGLIHLLQGNASAALSDSDTAIRLNPRDLGAYVLRSMVRLKSEQYDLAIIDAAAAIKVNPKYAKAYLARLTAHRGAGNSRSAQADRRMFQQLTAGYTMDLEDLTDIDFY